MTKLLKGVGIAVIAIFIAYFLLIDGIIRSQLERYGSAALQVPLSIGKVTFHLLPTTLTLRDVQIGSANQSTQNLAQADELSLPLSLRDLLAHKLIIETIDIHNLRFNRPHDPQAAAAPTNTTSVANSPQLREALQRVQQMINHPLASNTIDPNTSIAGAVLADQFKPLLAQISTALNAFASSSSNLGDWQILARRIQIDGALDIGSSALRFVGNIENATPQPALFDVATHIDVRNADGEPATLNVSGSFDKRKLAQAALRFDLNNFTLSQWPLSRDPELTITVISAVADIQAMLSLTGNQFDLHALSRFQQARFDIANGSDAATRAIADVWRRTDAFDINLQASGDLSNPLLKLNSSLDVPLANAIQQLQPASALSSPTAFPTSP